MEFIDILRDAIMFDRRAHADPHDPAMGTRTLAQVNALVLHQTGFNRGDDHAAYDRLGVHFVITPNGTILQLFDETVVRPASNTLNWRSVAVEFVGNFPLQSGRWWQGAASRDTPTRAQIEAGRALVDFLRRAAGITHVFAHRQATSPNRRGNCPGPHVWRNVGEWALGRGLSDGGAGFSVGAGAAIPDEWRDERFDLMGEAA